MSYTTLTQNKRTQLKSQMDDFATFQWRGHDMWEKYGCFIINESKGSLKFYNGPGYSNKYAKPQFSSSTNTLIGVDFKQKTISMKVGMYWFTIEEYQEFLNEIGPYVVNYLTFGYEKNYGYLVKLANITDSPRYIIGTNEKGNYVYYTEMDLNWELLGDNCVRSNLPYEYSYNRSVGEWNCRLDSRADMTDDSLLDTPILFELPLSFTSETAKLELQAVNKNNPQDCNMLFHINLQNLTYSFNNIAWYRLLTDKLPICYYSDGGGYINTNYTQKHAILSGRAVDDGVDWIDESVDFSGSYDENNNILTITTQSNCSILNIVDSHNLQFSHNTITMVVENKDYFSIEVEYVDHVTQTETKDMPILYQNTQYSKVFFALDLNENRAEDYVVLMKTEDTLNTALRIPAYASFTLWDTPNQEQKSLLKESWPDVGAWSQSLNSYHMLIRYDSETGLIYIQEGNNDTWHLLNFQTDNNTGQYLLQSAQVSKWKIPGLFSTQSIKSTDWKFKLTVNNIDMTSFPDEVLNTAITVYARKNIV